VSITITDNLNLEDKMSEINGTTNAKNDSVIEQYKSYYKKMNIEQYGTGVLLSALGESSESSDDLSIQTATSSGIEELFANQSVNLSINKDNIKKKMWADLEKEVQKFMNENKDMRGEFVVAVNTETKDGQPEFKISSKETIVALLDEEYRSESLEVMTTNPVQLFQPDNMPIEKLTEKENPELAAIVQNFLQKNRGVFQYLAQ
jgi:hypothetical protein